MLKLTISKGIIKPYNILIITNLLSFFAWLFPGFGFLRKGFKESASIFTIGGISYLISLIFIITCSFLAYHLTRKLFFNKKNNYNSSLKIDSKVYFFSIFISLIGIISVINSLLKNNDLNVIYSYLLSGKANEIKYILYENYSIGLVSLRYCAIISASFFIYRRLIGIKKNSFDLISLLLLLLVTLISSRLSLIASLVGAFYMYISVINNKKFTSWKIISAFFITFIVLSILNWSRNSGFYENLGLNFWSSGLSEIITYLGTPVQGAITAFSHVDNIKDIDTFYFLSTIELVLNTNSSFHVYLAAYGYIGIIYLALLISFSSILICFFEKYKNGKYIYVNIPLVYSTAEFWRLPLFTEGIIITLVICALSLAFISKINLGTIFRIK
ncbi:O-antigen polymerase [Xenorhabdus bovienii]|uniref:O-antigen polymerase n=1 Tax=Xenorhabdus bovienii TaxID=40576 RepID=UPI0023B34513|nr:O-antigen polymerase [Xenorhabdus bovienii]MDE9550829.1 oligosaccharide repeat unit polymerase [Xenorhabdus bovienii]